VITRRGHNVSPGEQLTEHVVWNSSRETNRPSRTVPGALFKAGSIRAVPHYHESRRGGQSPEGIDNQVDILVSL
jgi:hypothetical protein